jgi:hypothetical protein
MDLEAVFAHFEEGIVWSSPKATQAVGVPTVFGKAALRDYLMTVLRPATALRFTVHRIIWDPETSELSIIYDRDINGHRDRASEILHFATSGRVDRGEVHYGVVPQAART